MGNLLIEDGVCQSFKTLDELKKDLITRKTGLALIDKSSKMPAYSQDSNGKLVVDFGQGKYNFSETGFDRYCKLINAPSRFVKGLPYDNIIKDLSASMFKSEVEKINLLTQGSTIMGASSKDRIISPLEIIESGIDPTGKEFPEISISEGQMLLRFTKSTEVMPFGEVLKTGLAITQDIGSGAAPSLDYYFLRLVCLNGAVARKFIKIGKFSGKMEKSKVLEVLKARIETNFKDKDMILKECITRMTSSIITPDDRKYIKLYLSAKMNLKNHEDISNKLDIQVKDGSNYYDLMNVITDGAKNYGPVDKFKFESLGGTMIEHFLPVKSTSEIFPGYCEFRRKKIYKEKNEA